MQATRPEVGDEVTVLWYGKEYKCTVTMVEDTRVKVHYKGFNAGHDLISIWDFPIRGPRRCLWRISRSGPHRRMPPVTGKQKPK